MNLYREMVLLAFRQFMGDRADSLLRFLGDRFNDHSQRLDAALRNANERAWRCLEVALAGSSWWSACKSMLSPRDEQGLQRHIQGFLASLPATELPGDPEVFRKRALADLRGARRDGLVPGPDLASQELTNEVRTFARYSDPQKVIELDRQAVEGMSGLLKKSGYTDLAVYISLRPGQGQPLLVQAVRYFFRREIETDERLRNGLTMDRLEGLDTQLTAGLDGLHVALKEHGDRLENLLSGVAEDVKATMEIASGTRDDVRLLRAQLDQQSDQIHQLMRMLQQQLDRAPATSAGTPTAVPAPTPPPQAAPPLHAPVEAAQEATTVGPSTSDWNQVRQLLARVQRLTPDEQKRRPELARVVGQLTSAAQGYETTRRTILHLQQSEVGKDPLPIYPTEPSILDALPADEQSLPKATQPTSPLTKRPPKLISSIFTKNQPLVSGEPGLPAQTGSNSSTAEPPPEPAEPAPQPKGKRRLLSKLFDPGEDKGLQPPG